MQIFNCHKLYILINSCFFFPVNNSTGLQLINIAYAISYFIPRVFYIK